MNTLLYNTHQEQLLEACEYSQDDHNSYNVSQGLQSDDPINCTPLRHAYNRYIKEVYPYSSVTDWLQGLALNVEYNYYDIAKLFENVGLETEDNEGDYLPCVTNHYWCDAATVLINEWKKEGLDVEGLS